MGKPQRSKQRKAWIDIQEHGFVSMTQDRHRCEYCDKVEFHSKHEARGSLTGQLRSKSMRVYACPVQHGIWHMTKDHRTRIFHS